jgi:acyl carrier protein
MLKARLGKGVLMAYSALVPRFSKGSLEKQIYTFIAQYLRVDVNSIDAHSSLTNDFGLDLLDSTELMIVLERQFCPEREITEDPNEIESVDDLIHHIQRITSRNHIGAL